MDTDYRPSQVQNTIILLLIVGGLDISLGIQSIQFSYMTSSSFQAIIGVLMIICGLLTFCTSLVVWLQKSWATKLIAGVGISFCAALIMFGYYTIAIIVFAPLYWLGMHWITKGQPAEDIDWAPSWDED